MIIAASLFLLTSCREDGSPASGGGADAGGEVRIGIIAPLSGPVSSYGIASSNGTILAFEEIDEILGRSINTFVYDDRHDTTEAITAFNRLVNQDNVIGIVGPVTSGPTNAVGGEAADTGVRIPMVSPTATHQDVTSHGDFIFRACFLDNFQARNMAVFAIEYLGAETAAILYDVGSAYSEGLMVNFRDEFVRLGGTVVENQAYQTGDVDFRTQLTTIRASEADVLFLPDYYQTIALMAAQVRELGVTSTLLGVDGWEGVLDVLDDPSLMDGTFFSAHFAADDPSPIVQNFIASFTTRWGAPPNSFAALGFDAAHILAQAIEDAGSTDSGAIIEALQNIRFYGVTGNITFDDRGDPIKDLIVIQISTVNGETSGRYYERVSAN